MSVVRYDWPRLLLHLTGEGGWEEADMPDSGHGVDFWYDNGDGVAVYINLDQGYVTVSKAGTTLYSGFVVEDYPDFVTESALD